MMRAFVSEYGGIGLSNVRKADRQTGGGSEPISDR
jgi:hypothetical protein